MRGIELRVPDRVVSASTMRLVAASMAADAGFTVDDVDIDGPTLTLIKHRHQRPPDDR